jgi:hypothetical protein
MNYLGVHESCATNSCVEHGKQVTCNHDKSNFNELLNGQRNIPSRAGLAFVPETIKKKKKNMRKDKKKQDAVTQAGNSALDQGGNSTPRAKNSAPGQARNSGPTHNNSAGEYNPHYVLCRDYYGNLYAKYVGPWDDYVEWAIWVPKILVTNKRGPIQNWVPKTKN